MFPTSYLDSEFDIAFVSELSHRERSAFKPVYSMTKWWARRSSSVFRSLLLAVELPPGTDLPTVFYENHQVNNAVPDEKVILDPFMGGGTTIVEGLRLGYKAIGVDLNPHSWFTAKIETTPVDDQSLLSGYKRLQKKVESQLHQLYQTDCPCGCGKADILHAFWAKVAPCTHRDCDQRVTLYRDYVVGKRRGSAPVRYFEVTCPSCRTEIDVEVDKATVVQQHYQGYGFENGQGWVYWHGVGEVTCPCCKAGFLPQYETQTKTKKVSLYAILCPQCQEVFPHRGKVPSQLSCPSCNYEFDPKQGNTANGKFTCSCGHTSKITDSVAMQPNHEPLSFRMFAIEGYCSACARGTRDAAQSPQLSIFAGSRDTKCNDCSLAGHRFYKTPSQIDLDLYNSVEKEWLYRSSDLPWPREAIHDYEKTNRLVIHNYHYWIQLFNPRQRLALAILLQGILGEPDQNVKEALVASFLGTLEHQNILNIYYVPYAQSAGAFGRHDYHPKIMVCEGNVWGVEKGRGTFRMVFKGIREGKKYLRDPYDASYVRGKRKRIYTGDGFGATIADSFSDLQRSDRNLMLKAQDSRSLEFLPDHSVDYVITDPPYADGVQYSELADFFYVWLRVALVADYPEVLQEPETPKIEEIVENKARKKSQASFHRGLQEVFQECNRVLKPDGRLVFTFHHGRRSQWSDLLNVLIDAGYLLIAAYPVSSEGTRSGNLVFHSNKNSIAYDIIHVCRKATENEVGSAQIPVMWNDVERLVFDAVLRHMQAIMNGGDHGQRINVSDVEVMVWGECLNQYAKHYGHITDDTGRFLTIEAILEISSTLVDRLQRSLDELRHTVGQNVQPDLPLLR